MISLNHKRKGSDQITALEIWHLLPSTSGYSNHVPFLGSRHLPAMRQLFYWQQQCGFVNAMFNATVSAVLDCFAVVFIGSSAKGISFSSPK